MFFSAFHLTSRPKSFISYGGQASGNHAGCPQFGQGVRRQAQFGQNRVRLIASSGVDAGVMLS